jgi:hypothetical protein
VPDTKTRSAQMVGVGEAAQAHNRVRKADR